MGKDNNQSENSKLARLVNTLQSKIAKLEENNIKLENRLKEVEEKQAITSHVNDQLNEEIDRLNQYTRRSNLIIRNVLLPEEESSKDVKSKVEAMVSKEMKMPDIISEIDKAHRIGKVVNKDGKKLQNIIVRFKSHSARYVIFNNRKLIKNKKISPNLTHKRGKILDDAKKLTDDLRHDWGFVFANEHGDLLFRLTEAYKGKHYFPFISIESLSDQLKTIGLLNV